MLNRSLSKILNILKPLLTCLQRLPQATLIICLCCPLPALAVEKSTATPAAENKIADRYQRAIDKLSSEISTTKAHRTALVTRMDETTKQMDGLKSKSVEVSDNTPSLSSGIETINQDIASLDEQLRQKESQFRKHQSLIEQQPEPTMIADALGSTEALQQHRALAMQKYLLHKSQVDIQRFRAKQEQLKTQKVALSVTSEKLKSTMGQYQSGLEELTEIRRSLELQFTELSSTIVQKQDRQEQLKLRMGQIQSQPHTALFSYYRGQLPDPTAGKLQHSYNDPKARGLLKWEGILISASLGQPIEAVFDGTVLFADHMQGLGNVAIIDHGEGYMSLYGMADFLIVEPGQELLRGDTIGNVGGDADNDKSTLYFEIRHNADTQNPQDWLSFERISKHN